MYSALVQGVINEWPRSGSSFLIDWAIELGQLGIFCLNQRSLSSNLFWLADSTWLLFGLTTRDLWCTSLCARSAYTWCRNAAKEIVHTKLYLLIYDTRLIVNCWFIFIIFFENVSTLLVQMITVFFISGSLRIKKPSWSLGLSSCC